METTENLIMRNNHEMDYKLFGEEFQFVEIELDPGEIVVGQPGDLC